MMILNNNNYNKNKKILKTNKILTEKKANNDTCL